MFKLIQVVVTLILFFSLNAFANSTLPDFIVVGIKMNPVNPQPGDQVIFTMTVENIGADSPAGEQLSGAFFVNGIKSTWSTGNGNMSSLPHYGYRDLVADGGPYNGNSPYYTWGSYAQTITAVINDVNRIQESDTSNNSYSLSFPAPASLPDFIVVGLKMSPPNPVPGNNVTFTMTVENIGADSPAGQQLSGAFFVNGIKSTWSTGNGNTASLPHNGYRDLIADGGPYNGNSPLYRWGNYAQNVTAVINDANRIQESNTGNNSYSANFPAQKLFYGINGHPDYPMSNADLLKMLQGLGVTNYRINTGTSSASITQAASLAKYLIAGGIQILPVLDCGILGNPGDENGAFAAGYQLAVQMVLAFQGLGIKVYEVGNELDRKPSLWIDPGAGGNKVSDYYNSGMANYRGTVRGLIEGVHAAQWDALAGVNFYGADISAADMLWNGTQPDGTSGYPVTRWDITMWHDYEINLPIFNIGVDGGGTSNPALNIPEYAKRYNNNPFWLTEFGPNWEDSSNQKVAYLNSVLPDLYNNRLNDNIGAIFLYQLDGQFGLIVNDQAVPIQFYPEFYSYQSFITANPE